MIKTPYLLFLGDAPDQLAAKVAIGIKDWRPENAVAQYRMPGCGADLGIADMSLREAKESLWLAHPGSTAVSTHASFGFMAAPLCLSQPSAIMRTPNYGGS